ncbi:MAG: hypothetical protein CSA21_01680 [Deltaproteobacteria bacterium]|nr:MAG: hypothetical protein CSA21_01680 [Deltaproteobacteria bacterium]
MRKIIVLLGLLLACQVAVVTVVHIRQNAVLRGGGDTAGPLFAEIDPAAIQEVRLVDDAGKQLLLRRDDNQWVLPEYFAFTADTSLVEKLLSRLANLDRGWPEATTDAAATRFKVADQVFERRLVLSDAKGELTLFFGASPGMRKIYCRKAGDREIHAVPLALHDLSVEAKEWIDPTILHLDEKKITRLELPGLVLVQGEQGLEPEHLAKGERVQREALDRLVGELTRLDITAVLEKNSDAAAVLKEPELVIRAEMEDGTTLVYELARPLKEVEADAQTDAPAAGQEHAEKPEENREPWYLLRVSGHDLLFRVDGWRVNGLKAPDRETLVKRDETSKQFTPSAAVRSTESVPAK